MKTSFAVASLIAASQAMVGTHEFRFMEYVAKHNKAYKTVEEFNMRFENYMAIDAEIEAINHPDSGETHTAAHNKFSDWTREEYRAILGLRNMTPPAKKNDVHEAPEGFVPNGQTVNWVTKGNVWGVKDQGQCGSCWSFSTTGALQSAWSIKTGQAPPSLSEQQLVDCSHSYGNDGCMGGWYYYAWEYLSVNVSMFDQYYPYTSGTTGHKTACAYNAADGSIMTSSSSNYTDVAANTSAIMSALNKQPVSVAVEADTATFQTYSSGIITSSKCGTNIDHAITAVGYGTNDAGVSYYIVQNSWGTGWGDQGYVAIGAAGGAGICGINQYVAYPNVA